MKHSCKAATRALRPQVDTKAAIESHRTHRIGWLRAMVLGADDGILSTASLIIGVAAAEALRVDVIRAGVAGLVAGALSMAAGEYVSVSSQADTQLADLATEDKELAANPKFEVEELANIYIGRGLDTELARQVAAQLMKHDALGAHARDELYIFDTNMARPTQAALASAGSFAVGATLPLIIVFISPIELLIPEVFITSLALLAVLGGLAAHTGGASILRGAARVTSWGVLAMGVTAGIGAFCSKVL